MEIEKDVVNNVNKILASSLDVKHVIRAVHTELKRVLDCARMTVALFDEAGKEFHVLALSKDYEPAELVAGILYPKSGTHFGRVAETGLPALVIDTAESDYWIAQN